MRARLILPVVLTILGLLAAGVMMMRHHAEAPRPAPRLPRLTETIALPDGFEAPTAEVLPMHKAVRLATRRFAARVLDIALEPAIPAEQAAGVDLVYRLRMVTHSRDVLDIRMDALSGRFIDVRGADLSAARRAPGKERD